MSSLGQKVAFWGCVLIILSCYVARRTHFLSHGSLEESIFLEITGCALFLSAISYAERAIERNKIFVPPPLFSVVAYLLSSILTLAFVNYYKLHFPLDVATIVSGTVMIPIASLFLFPDFLMSLLIGMFFLKSFSAEESRS